MVLHSLKARQTWNTLLLALMLASTGCRSGADGPPDDGGYQTRQTAAAEVSPTPAPTAVPADSGWDLLQAGLERRLITTAGQGNEPVEQLYLLRLEPEHFVFSVAYRPGRPQTLENWQGETGALIVVNGGFFTEAYQATGRIISEGRASGTSYDFGGMFVVSAAGPEIRWLRRQPYNRDEHLLHGLQSFPLLIRPGGVPGPIEDSDQRSRRTVVAKDGDGRLLFLVARRGLFSLGELSGFLAASDLALDVALNLDGGSSSGLMLARPAEQWPALVPLPSVILVHER